MNPYDDRILPDPETPPAVSVLSYNREHLDTIVERVTSGIAQKRNATQATVVLSSNPGSGKTHLLSRFIDAVSPLALPVFIPPVNDRGGLAHAVLNRTVSRLWHMNDGGRPVNRFEWLALQLLGLACSEDPAIAAQWREFPVDSLRTEFFQEYLNQNRATLDRFLSVHFDRMVSRPLNESSLSWAGALLDILSTDPAVESFAVEWIKGRANFYRESEAEEDQTSGPDDEAVRAEQRLFDLQQFFALCKPLVFVFDQVENFGAFGREALQGFFVLVERLLVQCPSTQVVIAANAADWNAFVALSGLPEGYRDRFHSPKILRGLTDSEARELRDLRAGPDRVERAREQIPDAWIDQFLQIGPDGRPGHLVTPRRFLERCAARWEGEIVAEPIGLAPATRVDLGRELERARLVAGREAFGFYAESVRTFFTEVLGAEATVVDSYEFLRLGDIFVFVETGSNWNRWEAWARRAAKVAPSPAAIRAIRPAKDLCALERLVFTPVPAPNWRSVDTLRTLLDKGMRIELVDSEMMLEILGTCRLMDAATDLGRSRNDIARWLRDQAVERWRAFLTGPSRRTQESGTPAPPSEPSHDPGSPPPAP